MSKPFNSALNDTANSGQQGTYFSGAGSHPLPNSAVNVVPLHDYQPSHQYQPNYQQVYLEQAGYPPVHTGQPIYQPVHAPQSQVYQNQYSQPQIVSQPAQMLIQVQQPTNFVLIPAADDPNFLDFGPPPVWIGNVFSFFGGFSSMFAIRNSSSRLSLQHPQSNQFQIVASATCSQLQTSRKGLPLVYPLTSYQLSYNPASIIASACSEAELTEFVEKANDQTKDFIKKTDKSSRCTSISLIMTFVVMVLIGIVIGIITIRGIGVLIAFLGLFIVIIGRCCYVSHLTSKTNKLHRDLAQWIKDHRGPFYARGIRPRPGHNGTFIIFEANLAPTT